MRVKERILIAVCCLILLAAIALVGLMPFLVMLIVLL